MMKRILTILGICLLPFNAHSFELTIPFTWDSNGFTIGNARGDIMRVAMSYNGYDAKKNRKELQAILDIDPVKVPWCAGFINYVLEKSGYDSTGNLSAASYHHYGMRVTEPQPGDIVLMRRSGGSGRHVAFFYGWQFDNDGVKYIQLLGGNQDDAVNITAYPVAAIVEYRRPIKKLS
ncbi:MAG: hypothetical protein RLZZ44_38, partial [Bacteroidota bacterium]